MATNQFWLRKLSVATAFLLALFGDVLSASATTPPQVFGIVGDYGRAGTPERNVASLIQSWNPDYVVTVGDNNYDLGGADTIDANIGQFYHDYIANYKGTYGAGGVTNRFWPALGNHDWRTPGAQPYLDYFTLPGNERYYDFVQGPIHFFVVDSDPSEPDGNTFDSLQGRWLQNALAAATEPWKIVYFHHPPYSSGPHGSSAWMQWPFRAWGADIVFSGHDHVYERLEVGGFPYIANGLGGRSIYNFGATTAGSVVRYNADYGAMRAEVDEYRLSTQFIARTGAVADNFALARLHGQINRLSGVGLSGVVISATDGNAQNPHDRVDVSLTDGAYNLRPLPQGTYMVVPRLTGFVFSPAQATVTIGASGAPAVNFVATALPQIIITTPSASQSVNGLMVIDGRAAADPGGTGLLRVLVYLRRDSDGLWWQGTNWGTPRTALLAALTGTNWSLDHGLPGASSMPAGAYTITAYAYDRARNYNAAVRHFYSAPSQ